MKETSIRKTIMKQSKDLKQIPLTGLKSAMTVSKKSSIKEDFLPKFTSRYTELPSLRYGVTPSQNAFYMRDSGPLRVSFNYDKNFPKKKPPSREINGNFPTPVGNFDNCSGSGGKENEETTSVRRVHFAELPPKANSFDDFREMKRQYGGEEEKEETENWVRNRGIPFIDCNSESSSSRFSRFGFPSSANFHSTVRINGGKPPIGSSTSTNGNRGTLAKSIVPAKPLTLKQSLRGHDTAKYHRGTLTQATAARQSALLAVAKGGSDEELAEILKKASLFGISPDDLNAADSSGRTALSYIASNGTLSNLKAILQLPKIDVNKPDNEGNTPLHFASQAGQVEAINYMLSVCTNLEVDSRNALGFTPLMKAALQGRTKCAKLLLFAGASPTLRDSGRGLRAEQWAKFCGRSACADVIEKFTKHKLLDRNSSYERWGSEPVLLGEMNPMKPSSTALNSNSSSIKSRLRKAFRTMSHPGSEIPHPKSFSVVSQLTSAALCASSPVLQSSVSPSIKSLMRPLAVPKVQVTLASNFSNDDLESLMQHSLPEGSGKEKPILDRSSSRNKKKK